jgi:hypothetical protein
VNDPRARVPDADFIRLIETVGPLETARRLKLNRRTVFKRRTILEKVYGRQITAQKNPHGGPTFRHNAAHPGRLQFDILNGVVLIGSDAHIWPGALSTAMLAFIKFARELKPRAVILNGDVLDFPQISRHSPIGWEHHPTVADELAAAQSVLRQIEDSVGSKNSYLAWTLGNHDGRFETRIATLAPQLAKVKGVHLRDHFSPRWSPCWSVFINDDVVVKHRFKSGTHAPHNNTMWSGRTMITGHLHSQKVYPLTDYNGTRWGVDTGCLADPSARAFVDYSEDNPKSWRSGFAVLTFVDGELLPPELVTVWDERSVVFRGQIIEVGHETPQEKDRPKAEASRARSTRRPSVGRVGRLVRGSRRQSRKRGR